MQNGNLESKALTDLLAAAKVDDPKAQSRIFTVGPYGDRVGFAYQQSRAFNVAAGFSIVFARNWPENAKSDVEIAVLGGGIAGITLVAALTSLGFTGLKLFERKCNVLMDQAYASHRLVHPGYNTWPLTDEFSSTTRFPFLNWYAGTCDQVISLLRKEWEDEWKPRLRDNSLHMACCVVDASYDQSIQRVAVVFRDHTDKELTEHFDFVFFTLGFGFEKGVALSSKSAGRYWDTDTIRAVAEDHQRKKLLCVGDGDGALIDCSRLSYQCNVFDVAANVMAQLSTDAGRPADFRDYRRKKTEYEIKICKAEREAKTRSASPEDVTDYLKTFYTGFMKALSVKIRSDLDEKLVKKTGYFVDREIHLVGRSSQPFLPGTAPINKLLMAHLLDREIVRYHQGSLDLGNEHTPPKLDAGEACPNLEDFDYCVVRIGAEAPISAMFKDFEVKHKTTLRETLNRVSPNAADPNIFSESDNTVLVRELRTPGTRKNLEFRKTQIEDFMRTYYGGKGNHPVDPPKYTFDDGSCIIEVADHDYLHNAALKLGGYDWHLFGIPLKSSAYERQRKKVAYFPTA